MFRLSQLLDEPPPTITVLDIGAAGGGSDKEVYGPLLNQGTARVVGFEPDQAACAELNRKFGPRNVYLPHLLFDGTRRKFYVTGYGYTSSLYQPDHDLRSKFHQLSELAQVVRIEELDTRRLDDIEEMKGGVDFIKADAQGAEYEIYRHGANVVSSGLRRPHRSASAAGLQGTAAILGPGPDPAGIWISVSQVSRFSGAADKAAHAVP